jgi:hypothetical protein
MPSLAMASSDPRLQVSIPQSNQLLSRPPIEDMAQAAAPLLWDRLIPRKVRRQADALPVTSKLVSRIIPARDETLVVFNASAVFHLLQQAGLPHIRIPPRFNLKLMMKNSSGSPMGQSEQLLYKEAGDLAEHWGITLEEKAPALVLAWQWLNLEGDQATLTVRGNSKLAEYTETRLLPPADPVEALRGWLEEVLLRARDAYAVSVSGQQVEGDGQDAIYVEEILIFDRPMSLGEQVVIESGLKSDRRVRAVIPKTFSARRQVYTLILEGYDDSWLADWFQRRGMVLKLTAEGWVAH